MTAEEIRAAARAAVADWPPLTDEDVMTVVGMLTTPTLEVSE
ncbi:hypothetical protein ACFOYW_08280 [Gryllotalpicola reticulitermitis]|uniref:Uncharacterized protein n=1 Tax=Gryllotalpicola reticulitermitis TaxID=1184153 RepID=A0ABV8Q7P4_9MICO